MQGLALTLAGLILLETFVLLVFPDALLDLAKIMAEYRTGLMVVTIGLGGTLFYFLLRSYTLAEITAVGFVIVLFYGVLLMPYYDTIVEQFASDHERGILWIKIGPGLLLWVALAAGVVIEWWLRF